MTDNLISKIEAILFYLAEPVSIDFLSKTLEISKKEVVSAVEELKTVLNERGVRLVGHDEEVSLVTAPEFSELIEKIIKEERDRDLGRAGVETLAIITYKGPVSKKEIEYIRGVNCQYALRGLLLRGLVEKKESRDDGRSVVYSITGDTLRFLGLSNIKELPEYDDVKKELSPYGRSPEGREITEEVEAVDSE